MVLSLIRIFNLAFSAYTLLLFIRVISSWVPSLSRYRFIHFSHRITDPYLNIFKRIIPPIGGALDLSPIIGFFALEILQRILTRILISFA